METLHFRFPGQHPATTGHHTLVGVVASGNLEILLETVPLEGAMDIQITTSARGFAEVWQAVLSDFAARNPIADLRVSINDAGATPAVVSLRLQQAVESLTEQSGGRR